MSRATYFYHNPLGFLREVPISTPRGPGSCEFPLIWAQFGVIGYWANYPAGDGRLRWQGLGDVNNETASHLVSIDAHVGRRDPARKLLIVFLVFLERS